MVVLTIVIIFRVPLDGVIGFWAFITAYAFAVAVVRTIPQEKHAVLQHLTAASQRLRTVEERWRSESGDESFVALRKELEDKYREANGLPALRQRKYDELNANIRQAQLKRFLDSHYIEGASISKIGPGRTRVLASFGIETAADVTESLTIPGFGPVYVGNLRAWRNSIERKFVFSPASGVHPSDMQALDNEIARKGAEIENFLVSGKQRLEQIRAQVLAARSLLLPQYESAWKEKLQLEVDLAAM